MILIVASSLDVASMNIRKQLLSQYDFEMSSERFHHNPVYRKRIDNNDLKIVTINEESTCSQAVAHHFNAELIIYISRHSSKSGTPTLSVHTPGNLTQKGGLPGKISIAPAYAMKEALLELAHQKNVLGLEYKVSYECTHHGPSLDVPTMFVELGSSLDQWKDVTAAEAVAHAAVTPILKSTSLSPQCRAAVGIGGPHYSMKFTRWALEGTFAFGHIIPKYVVPQVNAETIRQCVERTKEKAEVVLDWKGIRSRDKATLTEVLREARIQSQKI